MFMVRLVDLDRHSMTIVCESCGAELPWQNEGVFSLLIIDADAVGTVMLEHARLAHKEN